MVVIINKREKYYKSAKPIHFFQNKTERIIPNFNTLFLFYKNELLSKKNYFGLVNVSDYVSFLYESLSSDLGSSYCLNNYIFCLFYFLFFDKTSIF